MKNLGYFIMVVFLLIGLGLFGTGAYLFFNDFSNQSGNHADGKIISVTASPPSYKTKFVYKSKDHVLHFIEVPADSRPYYNPGDNVDVIYNPAAPFKAQINSFFHDILWILLSLITGAIFAGSAALGMLVLWNRKRR